MATHLEQQEAKRHEDYRKAEIADLKKRLTEAESRIDYILRRLVKLEDAAGIHGA